MIVRRIIPEVVVVFAGGEMDLTCTTNWKKEREDENERNCLFVQIGRAHV